MKLASVLNKGTATFGIVDARGFFDLRLALGGRFADLREFLRHGDPATSARLASEGPFIRLDDLVFLPPIPNADARMFALGWSYKDHQAETGKEAPTHPFFFSKLPQSMVGHGQPVIRPRESVKYDYEGEIVLLIGKAGRHIRTEDALAHIGGYAIGMDGSARDWQQHSVTAGKNFDASSSYGPWMVTADEIGDPATLQLSTRLNGEVMQRAAFGDMAWGLAELVHYVSAFTRLEVGDAISTGTPGGVGHKRVPQVFMQPGDLLEVEVDRIGILRNPVAAE